MASRAAFSWGRSSSLRCMMPIAFGISLSSPISLVATFSSPRM